MGQESAPPGSARGSERLLAELRLELDHALRQLEAREREFQEVRAQADELERATLHALLRDRDLERMRRLLSRLKERIVALHERAIGSPFETELLDLRTILEIHAPPGEDDEDEPPQNG